MAAPDAGSYSLTPSATDIAAGASLSVDWRAPAGSSIWDWIGLFRVGDPNTGELWYAYTGGAAAGTRSLTAPGTPGQYEVRYFPNNGRTDVKRSAPITVH